MHPAFALASLKLEQLKKEHDRFVQAYNSIIVPLKSRTDEEGQWAWVSLTATGIEHVYTGIESVLKTLVKEIDGSIHGEKEEFHKGLLAQSVVASAVRPAILSDAAHALIDELRGFRHAERNNYIHQLRPDDVDRNYGLMNQAMPAFMSEVTVFLQEMSARYDSRDAGETASEDSKQSLGPS